MAHEVTQQRPLFRQEVIDFQQHDRQWGRVVPLQPLSTRLTVWFIIGHRPRPSSSFLLAHYARKETVIGYLMPAAGTARVLPPQPGTVSALYVEQGQAVEEGQPLMAVTTTQIATNGEDVNAAILTSLTQQKDALRRQIALEERRTASERDRLNAQMQGLDVELGYITSQITVQHERIARREAGRLGRIALPRAAWSPNWISGVGRRRCSSSVRR